VNANETAPTRQRKPRPKPARSIRVEVRPEGDYPAIVRITVGKEHADYFVRQLAADYGRGFAVEKIGLHENEPPYHVNIDGDRKTCECKGFLRHGYCKHSDGIAALIAAGQL
jgi:SWIM zinc finger